MEAIAADQERSNEGEEASVIAEITSSSVESVSRGTVGLGEEVGVVRSALGS